MVIVKGSPESGLQTHAIVVSPLSQAFSGLSLKLAKPKSFLKAFRIEEIHSIKQDAIDCIATVNKNNNPIHNNCP